MRGDAQLLEAWRQGDRAAGSELFERHYPAIVRFFANKVTIDPADLIQDTFEACVKGRDRLSDDGFAPYLFGVAYNMLKRHYAKARVHGQRFDAQERSVADLSPGAGTMMADRDEHRLLLAGLRRLPLEHQTVLELFYWEGMTSARIAQALGQPHGTVRTRLRTARQRLEAEIGGLVSDRSGSSPPADTIDAWATEVRRLQDEALDP